MPAATNAASNCVAWAKLKHPIGHDLVTPSHPGPQPLPEAGRIGLVVSAFGTNLLEGVTDSPEAAYAAARILQALEIPMEIEKKQVFPRASIGICLVDRESAVPDAAELLRNAHRPQILVLDQ